jgi:hypothetical protein
MGDWLTLKEAAVYFYGQTGLKIPDAGTMRGWFRKGKRLLTRKRWVNEFIDKIWGEG